METEFVLERSKASIDAADIIKEDWVWPEKTLTQMKASRKALKDQVDLAGVNYTEMISARNDLDAELDEYHLKTVAVLRLARTRFRNDPVKRSNIQRLSAKGDSRSATFAEGKALEDQWRKSDPAWVPIEDLTLEAFTQYRADCRNLHDTYTTEHTVWRSDAEEADVMAEKLHDELIAWYSDATTIFPEGTAHGNMIRATVPTTYQPSALPEQAVITEAVSSGPGRGHLEFGAPNATTLTLLHKGPTDAVFAVVQKGQATSFDGINLQPGEHQYKAFGSNSRGNGPESAVATVAVAAQAVA
jgi:hypothetical protein